MFAIKYKDKIYWVHTTTERCYVTYDLEVGHDVYLPKEECEVLG